MSKIFSNLNHSKSQWKVQPKLERKFMWNFPKSSKRQERNTAKKKLKHTSFRSIHARQMENGTICNYYRYIKTLVYAEVCVLKSNKFLLSSWMDGILFGFISYSISHLKSINELQLSEKSLSLIKNQAGDR